MKIDACAKINLSLEVLGRRDDGYHALRSVVAPLSFADTLTFCPADVFSTDTGYEDDLILKAARVLAGACPSADRRPFAVSVVKRIPAGGGLGGGSADAAAALIALNRLWSCGLSRRALTDLGAAVGSDVPALVLGQPASACDALSAERRGGAVLMEGRGERVAPLFGEKEMSLWPEGLPVVLANPGVHASTPAVFGRCRPRADRRPDVVGALVSALRSGCPERVAEALVNDLEDPAVELYPEIGSLRAAMRECGVLRPRMSGSGASVFGVASSFAEAERAAARLASRGVRSYAARAWIA